MASSQDSGGSERPQAGKSNNRTYKKEFSLYVDVGDNQAVKARDVITAVTKLCGHGKLFACVPKAANMFVLTFADKTVADLVSDGIQCGNKSFECKPVKSDSMFVSFMNLDPYIPDDQITNKLSQMDIAILGDIRRLYYEETEVETGTRVCRVKLPPNFVSLPYLMKFSDGEKVGNYRVIHDHQRKLCHYCFDENHLFRDCPKFTCFKCSKQGHFKSQCKAIWCGACKKWGCETEHEAANENVQEETNDQGNDNGERAESSESELEPECENCGNEMCTCTENESDDEIDLNEEPVESVFGDFIQSCENEPNVTETETETETENPKLRKERKTDEQTKTNSNKKHDETSSNKTTTTDKPTPNPKSTPPSEHQTPVRTANPGKASKQTANKNKNKRSHNSPDEPKETNKKRVVEGENKD